MSPSGSALQNRLASLDRLAPVARLLNPSQLTLTAPFRGTRPSRCCGRWLRCFGFLQNLADAPPRPLTRSHRTSVRRRRPGCSEAESVGREPQRMVRRRSLCQKCRGWHRFSKGTCLTATSQLRPQADPTIEAQPGGAAVGPGGLFQIVLGFTPLRMRSTAYKSQNDGFLPRFGIYPSQRALQGMQIPKRFGTTALFFKNTENCTAASGH